MAGPANDILPANSHLVGLWLQLLAGGESLTRILCRLCGCISLNAHCFVARRILCVPPSVLRHPTQEGPEWPLHLAAYSLRAHVSHCPRREFHPLSFTALGALTAYRGA